MTATRDEPPETRVGAGRPLVILHLMKTGGFSLVYQVMVNVRRQATWGLPDEGADELTRMAHYSSVEMLRAIDPATRSQLEVVVGHLPFAAVDLAGFDRSPIATVLRDPVDRVVSYLKMTRSTYPDKRGLPLEQIYEDEFLGQRMFHDHQTKMLGMTAEQATNRPTAPEAEPDPELVAALRAEGYFDSPAFAAEVDPSHLFLDLLDTPVVWPVVADRSTLADARRNLDRIEVLGIHDEYDAFLDQLRARTGWTIDLEIRANRGASSDISRSFRRRIEAGNELDLELYEHARERVRRGGAGV